MQGFPLFAARKRSMFLRMVVLVLPVVFMVTLLSQTVLAQNTFVITDGDDVIVHTSYATDPAEALTEAGIDVDQDEYSATQNEEGGYDITVQRNDAVTVTCGGQTQQVRIEDATVADLLERIGVPTGEGYEISVDLAAQPVDGMQIIVDHHVINQETYTLDIPFEITTVPDPAMPLGQERIITEGIVGQELCTADVEYLNAQEISRIVTSKETVRETQPQVVAVGTGEAVGQKNSWPLIGDDVIVLPSGEVLTYYKKDTDPCSLGRCGSGSPGRPLRNQNVHHQFRWNLCLRRRYRRGLRRRHQGQAFGSVHAYPAGSFPLRPQGCYRILPGRCQLEILIYN